MPTIKLDTIDSSMRRFELIKSSQYGTPHTVVKVKKTTYGTRYTIKKVKWSKYKFINKFIKLYLRVRYI